MSAPSNENSPANWPPSGSAGWPRSIAANRLRPRADRQPPPGSHAFIRRVASAGFRLPSFMAVHKYLERCRANNSLPDREDLLHALIPWSQDYPAPRFC